ncbi:CinA family nicotinamide mononucleotide deamidase-related protein [Pelodictyon luteolum]|uniref:CinA-like protein n=1 Tax=Chlorobium luteolum (strain DSM 273 / BCRC 81028 / 2530) TaxID=319225 RepID=CINAL_CHLL3|nr:CinA family nicotinamide mononucleotide deamidase-related protein [Pelodictyon luteolum]Q3B1F7.1 RecName: Full=CinA-like protein [Pelodictyon luteolum DSM 273]ABB24824.1 competence/damage-inducible protein cinA [Pelodictyon luteolum DSM 273]
MSERVPSIRAEIVSVGDELLKGQRVNTNASFIARSLGSVGIPVVRVTACSDFESEMASVFREALGRADVVLVTGGLGPTRDDRTRKAAGELLGLGLRLDPDALREVERRVTAHGRTMSELMQGQAMVLDGSRAIPNTRGTAAGMIIPAGERFGGSHLVLMPGVPVEMEAMMELTVQPWLRGLSDTTIIHTPVKTTGIGESTLADMLPDIEDSLPEGTSLAYLPHGAGVDLMVSTIARDPLRAERDNAAVVEAIRERAAAFIFAVGTASLEETIIGMLASGGLTLSVAESCTGGLIASRLTDVPGSSVSLMQGFIVYSNSAKEELLGVSRGLIDTHGAVSEEVACAMALGCLRRSGTSIALATTGIAGPGGGSPEKPVGTLCLAIARQVPGSGPSVGVRTLHMHGDRLQNKHRFSEAALRDLWVALRGEQGG